MRIRVFGQYIHASIAILALGEAALFFVMLYVAALLRFIQEVPEIEAQYGPLWPRALLFSTMMMLSLMSMGLYSARQRARTIGMVVRVAFALLTGTTITTFVFYLVPSLSIGRGVTAIALIGSALGVILTRVAVARFIDQDVFKRRVLIYGCGRNAASIYKLRRRSDRRGFTPVGFVHADGDECVVAPESLVTLGSMSIAEYCKAHDVDEVVVAMSDRRFGFPILELLDCRLAGIEVTELLTFLERETGRVRIDVLNPSWLIFGEGFRRDTFRLVTARSLDLSASLIIVLLTLPVMLLTALLIKLEDGWRAPVFYAQVRIGAGGRQFNVLKFRSMRTDAERDGARWATKGDSRVTRVGALIRKTRIDELPQILCVLRGHMGFVGPRPERPEFVSQLEQKIPYYAQRHCVKPGITGWAQLCYPYGSSEQDALEKLQYDLYYIKNNSFFFDLTILLETVEVVFMGKGAR